MTDESSPPLISVALCTYNGARFLREQLDSLLAQTHDTLEIIAVDDCSSDNSLSILEEYARKDGRLRVLSNPENVGFKRNFEIAMRNCSGAFVAPCDQDDIWQPQKLSVLLAHIGARPLVYCDSELVNERGELLHIRASSRLVMLETEDPLIFTFGNCASGHAMLFRRELLNRALPFPQCFFHDWWLAAVAASCGGIAYCDEPLVYYRQHGDNVLDMLKLRGVKKIAAPKGQRLSEWREVGRRLESLATLDSSHRRLLCTLHRLWHARESQWLSIQLALLMACHIRRLYMLQWPPPSRFRLLKKTLKLMLGLKLKRLTNNDAYEL